MTNHQTPTLRLVPLLLATLLGVQAFAATESLRWRWSKPTPHGNNIVDMAHSPTLGIVAQVTERGQIYTSDDLAFWQSRPSGTTVALRGVTFWGARAVVVGENGTILYADSLDDFRPATLNVPTANWFEAVTAGPLLMAVGDNGTIYTSSTGTNWTHQSTPFNDWLRGVSYGSGTFGKHFVVVGENGFIATSPNGTTWTPRPSGTTENLNRVSFFNSRFWVAGENGLALTSSDGGFTWQPDNSGAVNHLYASDGLSGGQRLLAGEQEVRLFENGTWTDLLALGGTDKPVPWTYFSSFSQAGFFLIGGRSGMMAEGYLTDQGTFTWFGTRDPIRHWLWDIARVEDFYVTVGDRATVMTSSNGVDWQLELVPDTSTNSIFLGVAGTTNLLVAVGDAGSIIYSPNTTTNLVETAPDGTTVTNEVNTFGVIWHAVEPRPTTNTLQGITAFGDQFIAAGDNGAILTSNDAENWTLRPTPSTATLSGAAAFPGGIVVVGDNGAILTSQDGVSWTLRNSGTAAWLYRVRYVNNLLIILGQNGTLLTSADGIDWTPRTSGSTRWLNDVTYIDGAYYVVGNQGTVLSSADAVNWSNIGIITSKSLFGAATDGAQLVTAGVEGIILRSQVVPHTTPVNILNYSQTISTDDVHHLFLFGGKPDQRFALESLFEFAGSSSWISGAELDITDGSGTVLYLETGSVTNMAPSEFFRTNLKLPDSAPGD